MLLVIGIDGANPDLIERFTATGHMPTLRALRRYGVYGRLTSSPNCHPISAWASFLTGVNPGIHGLWDLRTLIPDSYEWQPAHARMLKAPTLSQILTERGLEVGTAFVPVTYPARETEWTTIAGWLAPSVDAPGFAHPRQIASLAARRLKGVPLALQLGSYAAANRYQQGIELAIEAMNAKCGLAEELLAERHWDMLVVNFTELDRVLRWYWHLIDPNHPDYREDLRTTYGELIVQMHTALDEVIARLIRGLRPSDRLIVTSTYSVKLNSRAALCVPELMSYLDLLVSRSMAGGIWHRLASRLNAMSEGAKALLHHILPQRFPHRVRVADENEVTTAHLTGIDPRLDYERTWVIPAPGGNLFINTEEEFPLGIVGKTLLDQLIMRVSSALQTCIDPATGRRPLEWVRRREQVCSGPYVDRIPHIVTRWDTRRVVEGLTVTGRNGHVRVVHPPSRRVPSGAPAGEGILIAAGAGLRRGVHIEGARVEDLTATIVYLCGERVPSYFEGRVLEEAITPHLLSERPVQYLDRDVPRIIEDPGRADEATRIVREHLRALGYEY